MVSSSIIAHGLSISYQGLKEEELSRQATLWPLPGYRLLQKQLKFMGSKSAYIALSSGWAPAKLTTGQALLTHKNIWNYLGCAINVPKGIVLEQENFVYLFSYGFISIIWAFLEIDWLPKYTVLSLFFYVNILQDYLFSPWEKTNF